MSAIGWISVQPAGERSSVASSVEQHPEYELMSSTDTHERRIDILEDHVTDAYLERIRTEASASSGGENGPGDDVDMVDALSAYGPETLDDVDEMEAEIDALQEKLDTVGVVLPERRCDEVRETITALQAATDAHSTYRSNAAEALAARIEVAG
jgi:hypothetical protein